MSSFHGIFSVGGLAGAAVAALAARVGLDPELHLGLVAAALLVLAIVAIPHLLPAGVDAGSDGPSFATPSRPLAVLGVIAFCVLLSEGAVGDWSAVYLEDRLGTSASLAALGYTAFALTMAAGRLGGDRLTQRLGPVAIVRWGGVLVAIGLGIGLLIEHPAAAIFGFAAVGAGLAVAFPVLLSAAGGTPGISTGTAIAAVATAGYTGFLVGPPLIGVIAEVIGLRAGLVVVVLLGVAMVLLSGGVTRAGAKLEQSDPHVAVPFGD
jgi:fucose permease